MSAVALHFFAGLLAGTRFGAQTILVLVLAVLVEGVVSLIAQGAYANLVCLLLSQFALQFGYLGGICLRSILERAGVATESGRRPLENPVRNVSRG
jgi:hypothetical protein